MNYSDIVFIVQWWLVFFIIGLIFLPLTARIFSNFFDKGYIFSKILGMAFISYVVFLLGILKILPFTEITISAVILVFLILNILISKYFQKTTSQEPKSLRTSKVAERTPSRWTLRIPWKIFLFEEALFLATLFFWSFIRAHQPEIHGLEKYMDFGFINSILRSQYFPPVDMWFPPLPINYYYFGHLTTAVLTKISTLPSFVTYNLMLSTIFAFTFTGAFSIGANLFYKLKERGVTRLEGLPTARSSFEPARLERALAGGKGEAGPRAIIAGLLSGFLLSMAGNLHTIYAFFKPYVNENPVPLWQLPFAFDSFPNGYWYPNATRFIFNTIHEFPIYSAVVSDLHGHYLDVPFVLLTIAILLSLFYKLSTNTNQQGNRDVILNLSFDRLRMVSLPNPFQDLVHKESRFRNKFGMTTNGLYALLLAFLLAIMYMTNAWDGIIYFILAIIVLFYLNLKISPSKDTPSTVQGTKFKMQSYGSTSSPSRAKSRDSLKLKVFSFEMSFYALRFAFYASLIAVGFFIFSLPFNLYFKPFASGIGVLCAPEFLTKITNFGPFLFEADHCQHSPWWQLLILYGFFYFWAISFILSIFRKRVVILNLFQDLDSSRAKMLKQVQHDIYKSDLFVLLLILFSTLLIIIPEFIYVKDIYPGHYRANTMFKLVYQAFIMLSISSAYIIIRLIIPRRSHFVTPPRWPNGLLGGGKWKLAYWIIGSIGLLLISIYPYFAINSYYGELKTYRGLDGLSYLKNLYPTDYEAILWINKNIKGQPIILEAQGDSYTDYARVSSNTGLPTVLGWPVHEWLWRGSYDIPSPRIPEVQTIYESKDLDMTKNLLKKHSVSLVFFGDLEREKYPNLNEEKFKTLGKVIYENGKTRIYDLRK